MEDWKVGKSNKRKVKEKTRKQMNAERVRGESWGEEIGEQMKGRGRDVRENVRGEKGDKGMVKKILEGRM